MNRNKNKFMLFICSFCPGAGHMYMGLMKQGLSIMAMFFALVFIASFLNVGAVVYLMPVLWFYSFFDCWNKRNLTDAEFYEIKDDYFIPFLDGKMPKVNMDKARPFIAVACILIGLERILHYFWIFVDRIIPYPLDEMFHFFRYNFMDALFAVFLIWLGIRLIIGKKRDMDKDGKGNYVDVEEQWGEEGK